MIEPLIEDSVYRNIYLFIYSFHMPVFIFVTGYFAKADLKGLKKLFKLFLKYELIYGLTYLLSFLIFRPELSGDIGGFNPLIILEPIWLMWYILSLIWWRMLLVLIEKSKLFLFVLLILVIGFNFIDFNFRILSIGRSLTFAPFFLMGYYTKKKQFDFIKLKKYRKVLLSFTIILSIFWVSNAQKISVQDLYGATSMSLYYPVISIVELKLLLYLLASYTGFIFMLFISAAEQSYTDLGAKTMPIFLYHGLIIIILKFSGVFVILQDISPVISLTIISLCSLFMVKYLAKLKV